MEGMILKFTPMMARHVLGHLSMFGPMVALLGLIASPNSPNRGLNLPLAAHPPPPPTPLPPARSSPIMCHQ